MKKDKPTGTVDAIASLIALYFTKKEKHPNLEDAKDSLSKLKESLEELKRRRANGEGNQLDLDIAIGQFKETIKKIEKDI